MALTGIDDLVVDSEQSSAATAEVLTQLHGPEGDVEHQTTSGEGSKENVREALPDQVISEAPPSSSSSEIANEAQAITSLDSENVTTTDSDHSVSQDGVDDKVVVEKSVLVSKIVQKAREAAAGTTLGDEKSLVMAPLAPVPRNAQPAKSADQKVTGVTKIQDQRITSVLSKMMDQKNTGVTRLPNQSTTGATRFTDQKSTGATRTSDQSITGATRFPDQRNTGSVSKINDQKTTGSVSNISDQRSTGSISRMSDQRSTGAVPRISDQRSTGATPSYIDQASTGSTPVKSLIGRTSSDPSKPLGEDEIDESAPLNSKKSLVATIQTEAKKSKVSMGIFEKIISKHPILVGAAAFCVFVVPIYLVVINSQSASERAEYKDQLGKEVKLIAGKLRKPGELNGHKVSFYVNRADAYIKSKEYQSAISDLKVARQLDPLKIDDYDLKLSECFLAVSDYKKAASSAAEVLKDTSTNVDALLLHGKASFLLGNKLTALDDFFKAIKTDPSNPRVFIERGDYYVAEKKPSSAAADYRHALELAPSLAEAKQKLAACTVAVRARPAAASIDAAEAAAKLSPANLKIIADSDFETLRSKGYQALQKGDTNFAIAALSRAVTLNPNGALVRQYLANALLAAGNYADSVAQFNAWDKIAVLPLSEKLAFARRLPADTCESAGALYTQLTEQHATSSPDLLAIATAAQAHGYAAQSQSAVGLGEKIGTAAEKAKFASFKVAAVTQAASKAAATKGMIAN